jgi:hypothetical protein
MLPSARTIARLMTTGRDTLSKSETVTMAAIENGVPLLIEARAVIAAFHAMIRKKAEAELGAWIEQARSGLATSFANGVAKDSAADVTGRLRQSPIALANREKSNGGQTESGGPSPRDDAPRSLRTRGSRPEAMRIRIVHKLFRLPKQYCANGSAPAYISGTRSGSQMETP